MRLPLRMTLPTMSVPLFHFFSLTRLVVVADESTFLDLVVQVDRLLTDLETRFDAMSTKVMSRCSYLPSLLRCCPPRAELPTLPVSSLSTRVDSLETSLSELMAGTAGGDSSDDVHAMKKTGSASST